MNALRLPGKIPVGGTENNASMMWILLMQPSEVLPVDGQHSSPVRTGNLQDFFIWIFAICQAALLDRVYIVTKLSQFFNNR